jgi:predicted membrane-bound mannosyltransferase
VFFSSFLKNPRGLLDAVLTYLAYLHRVDGASAHDHPWYFYLERLAWFHHGRGPVWTEGAILVLAAIGFAAALRRVPPASFTGHAGLLRFLGFYTLLLAIAYGLIAYKTPWCLLSFWLGAILLAGVGAAVIVGWQTRRWVQALAGAALVFITAHLSWQAWQTSYVIPEERKNPYAYAQTSPDILELVDKVNALARAHPEGPATLIKVMAPAGDYWPLPWYFRNLTKVGWWDDLPSDPGAPIMVVGARLEPRLDPKIEDTHTMTGIYGLRRGVFLDLYVAEDLWKKFMANKAAGGHP